MRKLALVAVLCCLAGGAQATTCGNVPYTFTNGTVADANQVNANFAGIFNCGNNSLAPKAAPAFTGPVTLISAQTTGSAGAILSGFNYTYNDQAPMSGGFFAAGINLTANIGGGSTSGSHIAGNFFSDITGSIAAGSTGNEVVGIRGAAYYEGNFGGLTTTVQTNASSGASSIVVAAAPSLVTPQVPIIIGLNSGTYVGVVTSVAGTTVGISPVLSGDSDAGHAVSMYQGAIFGYAGDVQATSVASSTAPLFGTVGGQIAVAVPTGRASYLKQGWKITNNILDTRHGDLVECMLCFSNQANLPWNHIIQVNSIDGFNPVGSNTTLWGVLDAGAAQTGLEWSTVTFSDYAVHFSHASITGAGTASFDGNWHAHRSPMSECSL